MKLNTLNLIVSRPLEGFGRPRTHEGGLAVALTPEQALRRSVLAGLLWESEFYESGIAIAERIRALVPQVAVETVAALAVEARSAMKLRHMPLLLVREMARHASHRALVAATLPQVIQRADERTNLFFPARIFQGLSCVFTCGRLCTLTICAFECKSSSDDTPDREVFRVRRVHVLFACASGFDRILFFSARDILGRAAPDRHRRQPAEVYSCPIAVYAPGRASEEHGTTWLKRSTSTKKT